MLKTATFEEQEYTPLAEREEEVKTVIIGIPLSKGEYDRYQDQIIADSVRSGRVQGGRTKNLIRIYRKHIHRIRNVIVDGEYVEELTTPDDIVNFLTTMADTESGNEIDNWILGISRLEKDEEKNSSGQSDFPSSGEKEKRGTAKNAKASASKTE